MRRRNKLAVGLVLYPIAGYIAALFHWWIFDWLGRGDGYMETTPGALLMGAALSALAMGFATAFTFLEMKP